MDLSIAKEFSETPGPRYREEGEYSGQEFLEELLEPKFLAAKRGCEQLVVDLDGTEGYATSFLEGAFGGIARKYDPEEILKIIKFKCTDEPFLAKEIEGYILEARQQAT